jgi:general secretion pathway protein I
VRHRPDEGFTLVEVLVALVVVAIGLAALMVAVAGTARTSGYLRDKTLAQWIALNRIAEVRLTVNKLAQSSSSTNGDTGELQFASRTWHYDTRYYDTQFQGTKRIVVRVWAGDAKTKGNPLAEAMGFYGTGLSLPGNSNATDWTAGNTAGTSNCPPAGSAAGGIGTPASGTVGGTGTGAVNCTNPNSNGTIVQPGNVPVTPTPAPNPTQ